MSELHSPVVDVDRFLRIGNQASKGKERRARTLDRRTDATTRDDDEDAEDWVSEPARRVPVAERVARVEG